MAGVIKAVVNGINRSVNPLAQDTTVRALVNAYAEDGIARRVKGFQYWSETEMSGAPNLALLYNDEMWGQFLLYSMPGQSTTNRFTLYGIASGAKATHTSLLAFDNLDQTRSHGSMVQPNEHYALVATNKGVQAIVASSTATSGLTVGEAGMPQPGSCVVSLTGNPGTVGHLQLQNACAYRFTLERGYGDGHAWTSAPSGRSVIRNRFVQATGSMSKTGTTVTITTPQPHGITPTTSVTLVVESTAGALELDLNFPPGVKTGTAASANTITYTDPNTATGTVTSNREYEIFLNTTRTNSFQCTYNPVGPVYTVTKTGGTATATLPYEHGLTLTTGIRVRWFYGTGTTPDANFVAGLKTITGLPTPSSVTWTESAGAASCAATGFVAFLYGTGASDQTTPELQTPDDWPRQVVTRCVLPLGSNDVRVHSLLYSKGASIDTGTGWTKLGCTTGPESIATPPWRTTGFWSGSGTLTLTGNHITDTVFDQVHSIHRSCANTSSAMVTLSVYAKKGTQDRLGLSMYIGQHRAAIFDLNTGTIINAEATTIPQMSSLGSGWYRCSVSAVGAGSSINAYVAALSSSISAIPVATHIGVWNYAGTGEAALIFWGPDFEYCTGNRGAYGATRNFQMLTASGDDTTALSVATKYMGDDFDYVTVPGAAAGDTINLYRSKDIPDPLEGAEPSDDMYLVDSKVLTATDISNGYVDFTDSATGASGFVEPLYTNPTDGDSPGAPRYKPPLGECLAVWDGRTWLGNVYPRHRLSFEILGTGSGGIAVGDYFALTMTDSKERWLFKAIAAGATRRNGYEFEVFTSGTVRKNCERTAQSLVQAINECIPCEVRAIYSGLEMDVGSITLEAKRAFYSDRADSTGTSLYANHCRFQIDHLNSSYAQVTTGLSRAPGSYSKSDHFHHGAVFSDVDEMFGWPLLNELSILPKGTHIKAMRGDRDRLYVFAQEGGIYMVAKGTPYRVVGKISDASLIGAQCVTELDGRVWAWTNQGVGWLSDAGLQIVSQPLQASDQSTVFAQAGDSALDSTNYAHERSWLAGDPTTRLLWVGACSYLSAGNFYESTYIYNADGGAWSVFGDIAGGDSLAFGCIDGSCGRLFVAKRQRYYPLDSWDSYTWCQQRVLSGSGASAPYQGTTCPSTRLTLGVFSYGGNYYSKNFFPQVGDRVTIGASSWRIAVVGEWTNTPSGNGYQLTFNESDVAAYGYPSTSTATVTENYPVLIEWWPISGGDPGVVKGWNDLTVLWYPSTAYISQALVYFGRDITISAGTVYMSMVALPQTTTAGSTQGLVQRIAPIPKAVAKSELLTVRVVYGDLTKGVPLAGVRVGFDVGGASTRR